MRGKRVRASALAAPGNVLGVLDRAYDLDTDTPQWIEGLLASMQPLLDDGNGVHAFRVDLAHGVVADPAYAGGTDEWKSVWRDTWWDGFMRRLPRESLVSMAEFGPVAHTTDMWAAAARQHPSFETLLARGGAADLEARGAATAGMPYPDSLNIVGLDTSGLGVVFCANRARIAQGPLAPAARWSLSRIVGHIVSASRLRASLRGRSAIDGADAVMSPRGTILHTETSARDRVTREALRVAAEELIASKSGRTADVLQHWRALYAGEYSLLDVFDSDGKRFIVARSNAPAAPPADGVPLTEHERRILGLVAAGCANKLIAYELGLPASTVASQVRRLMHKLGATSVAELISRARALRVYPS